MIAIGFWSKVKEVYKKVDSKVGGILPGGVPYKKKSKAKVVKTKSGSNVVVVGKKASTSDVVKAIAKAKPKVKEKKSPISPSSKSYVNQGTATLTHSLSSGSRRTVISDKSPKHRRTYKEEQEYAAEALAAVKYLKDTKETVEQRRAEVVQTRKELDKAEAYLDANKDKIDPAVYKEYKQKISSARSELDKAEVELVAKEVEIERAKKDIYKSMEEYHKQLDKSKREYGSDNDLKDYALSGGIGLLTGAGVGALTAGPLGAVVGGVAGLTSGLAGQAAGEYVTSKTANPKLGLAADIGVGLVSGIAEAKALSSAVKSTAKVTAKSSVKSFSIKQGENIDTFVKANTKVNIRALKGLVKETYDIDTISWVKSVKKTKDFVDDFGELSVKRQKDVYEHVSLVTRSRISKGGDVAYKDYSFVVNTEDVVKATKKGVDHKVLTSTGKRGSSKISEIKDLAGIKSISKKEGNLEMVKGIGASINRKGVSHVYNFKHISVTVDSQGNKINKLFTTGGTKTSKKINKGIKVLGEKELYGSNIKSKSKIRSISKVTDEVENIQAGFKANLKSLVKDISQEGIKSTARKTAISAVTASIITSLFKPKTGRIKTPKQKDVSVPDIGIKDIAVPKIDVKSIAVPDVSTKSFQSTDIKQVQLQEQSLKIDTSIPNIPIPDIDYAFDFKDFGFGKSVSLSGGRRKRKKGKKYWEIEYAFRDII